MHPHNHSKAAIHLSYRIASASAKLPHASALNLYILNAVQMLCQGE